MATVNSNLLALSATLITLQVRESASSRRSQEWISTRLLALVANCVNALNAYLHCRITLPDKYAFKKLTDSAFLLNY